MSVVGKGGGGGMGRGGWLRLHLHCARMFVSPSLPYVTSCDVLPCTETVM